MYKQLLLKDNNIIAKEGKQGTKKMLSKLNKNSNGILIKLPKPNKILEWTFLQLE
jgi:DUF1009 family protein